jgi:endonuclease YncB( thermonuclease family)
MRFVYFVLFTLLSTPAIAETIIGRVVGVADGDTVTILDQSHQQHKIRLMGIDAPEKAQPFGQKSKQSLSNLVFDREVSAECGKTDRYKRSICKIWVSGADANLAQVMAGMAWWYRAYSKEQSTEDRRNYEHSEDDARRLETGLWSDKTPIPPWEWRHTKMR